MSGTCSKNTTIIGWYTLGKTQEKSLGLAQIFRKDLSQGKLEKTRIKLLLSASPSLFFSHRVQNIRFERQIHIVNSVNSVSSVEYKSVNSVCS